MLFRSRVVEQANGEASALPTDTAMAGSRCHEPRAATPTQAAHCGDADSAAPVLSIWTFCPHGRGPASARPSRAGRTRLPMQVPFQQAASPNWLRSRKRSHKCFVPVSQIATALHRIASVTSLRRACSQGEFLLR